VLYVNQRLQRWCFDVELIYLAQRLRIPIVEAAVNWTEIAGELWAVRQAPCVSSTGMLR
jgi:hypothetical protein